MQLGSLATNTPMPNSSMSHVPHLAQAESLQEALWRAAAFADAGADVIFIDALESEGEMAALCGVPGAYKVRAMGALRAGWAAGRTRWVVTARCWEHTTLGAHCIGSTLRWERAALCPAGSALVAV
jgi:hypothetical protein